MDDRQTRLALSCALLAALAGVPVQAILLLRAATVATRALPGAVSAELRVTRTDLIGQVAAARILNEAPSTANHPARYAWAKNSIMNTQGMANALAPAVVMDTTVGADLLGTTDAQLQAAVEYAAQQLVL
jgi:hypothetical protein